MQGMDDHMELLTLDKNARRRLNRSALAQAMLLPCCIFTGMLALLSFSLSREHQGLADFVIACAFLVALAFALKAGYTWLFPRDGARGPHREPTWFLFLAATCLVAWLAGVALGRENYSSRMQPYYNMISMGMASNVDPADIPATQYMDASRIIFKEGSNVSEKLSLGYKDTNTYCVAPIIGNSSGTNLHSYDFWAVGINCCHPIQPAAFWCSRADLSDPLTHAGLRWMSSAQIPYFRLAIEQAEAEYGYRASNPMLLTWTTDPDADVEALRVAGIAFVVKCSVVYAIIQALLIAGFMTIHVPTGLRPLEKMKSLLA